MKTEKVLELNVADLFKRVALSILFIAAITGCRQNDRTAEINIAEITGDTTVVNVLYFRVKQRCETCNAVAGVTKKTIETEYAGNSKVRYIEIENSLKTNEALVEKYEVIWNALIIVKGDNVVDITQRAFLNAVNKPQILENLIKDEVDRRIKN